MNYVSEVAEQFLSLNSQVSVLSTTDYSTIAEWEKEEIPLNVVKAAISEACEGAGETGLASMDSIRPLVKTNFQKWLRQSQYCW